MHKGRIIGVLSSIAAAVSVGVCGSASAVDIRDTLPGPGDIPGWQIIPDTLRIASGIGLAEIYDGGYQMYLDFGVDTAATQLYQHDGGSVLTIISHHVPSPAHVPALYTYWRSGSRGQPGYREDAPGAFTCDFAGAAAGYAAFGNYVLSYSASDASAESGRAIDVAVACARKAVGPGPLTLPIASKLPSRGMAPASYRCAFDPASAARQYPELADWEWSEMVPPQLEINGLHSAMYDAPQGAEAYVVETKDPLTARLLFALVRLHYREDLVISSAWRAGYLEKLLYSKDLASYHLIRTQGPNLIYIRGAKRAEQARSLADAVARHNNGAKR